MNAVIYARFSSSSQTEQSIEGQVHACHEYARNHDITIMKEYVDRSKSGTSTDKRDSFQRMINDSSKKQFEVVLVYQFDRFARNRYDSATNKAKLKKNGVKLISIREQISDDASGVLMEAVLEGMAEYYSVELSQKIRRGLNINAEKRLVYGSVPWGYKSVNRQFVVDEETAPYVKKIFEMYNNGTKMIDICKYLNGLGIKNSTGNDFKITFINKLLQNKRYCGYYKFKDMEVKDGMPAIVSEELFTQVAEKMENNKIRPASSKAKDEMYLLTTKLFCGHCKSGMSGTAGTGKSGKLHQYYGCVNHFRAPRTCVKKNVRKKYIEDLVVKECYNLLTDENISKISDEVMKACEKEKDTSNVNLLEKALKELEKQKNNLIASLKVGASNESFQKMVFEQFENIEKKEIEIKKELILEDNLQNYLSREHILFFLYELKKGSISDYKYRQLLVNVFVNKIYLYDDKITLVFTTQNEKVEVDISFVEGLEGSYLDASSPVQSSPVHQKLK